MKMKNFQVSVYVDDKLKDSKTTGKMHDAWIEACRIRDGFRAKHGSKCKTEVTEI